MGGVDLAVNGEQRMTQRERRYFGTDGIRGKVGTPPITPDFIMKLGWAAGRVFDHVGKILGEPLYLSGITAFYHHTD